MNKRNKIIFRVATVLFSLQMIMGIGMYLFQYDMVAEMITKLQYPTYIIYPLAAAKALGLVAIWSNKSKILKEWAYAGFAYDLILAISAHINISDGGHYGALVALILLIVSYVFGKKLETEGENS